MKSNRRKLQVRRETLRSLSSELARRVAGGTSMARCLVEGDLSLDEATCQGGLSRYVNTVPQPCYNG